MEFRWEGKDEAGVDAGDNGLGKHKGKRGQELFRCGEGLLLPPGGLRGPLLWELLAWTVTNCFLSAYFCESN